MATKYSERRRGDKRQRIVYKSTKRDFHKRPVKSAADLPKRVGRIGPDKEVMLEEKPVLRGPNELLTGVLNGSVLPSEVTRDERVLCVGELLLRGVPQYEIANIFKISPAMVCNDKRRIQDLYAKEVTEYTAHGLIGSFIRSMWFLYGKAISKGVEDWRLGKDIQVDMLDRLMRLGVMHPIGPVSKTLHGIVVKHQDGEQSGNATGYANGGSTSVGIFEVSGLGDSELSAIERILTSDGAQGTGPAQP